jgi:pectin lyase
LIDSFVLFTRINNYRKVTMRSTTLVLLTAISSASAAVTGKRATYAVSGKPEGFAAGTTGGGSAGCAVPSSISQLTSWLSDSTARCIVLDKE